MPRKREIAVSTFQAQKQLKDQDYPKVGQAFISLACLTFFPMVYFIGKFVMQWMS